MGRSLRILTALCAGGSLVLLALVFARHQGGRSDIAHQELRREIPELAAHIESEIAVLRAESLHDSMVKLSDVNMYYSPGPAPSAGSWSDEQYLPLKPDADLETTEAILSNRRFRKVLGEMTRLSSSQRDKAAKMLNEELNSALAEYLPLYHAELQLIASNYPASSPAFQIGTRPGGPVVVVGARLKVLSLTWISGLLELTDEAGLVKRVARMAVEQRDALYKASEPQALARSEVLRMVSLYNRQLISAALLGTTADRSSRETALRTTGATWQERNLAGFNAALTEFDAPVLSKMMEPDHSQGTVTVRFPAPLDDVNFDSLLKALRIQE
jgi:hypothetical protein